jgi:hypothetical protein
MRNVAFVAAAVMMLGAGFTAHAGERAEATLASPLAKSRKAIIDGRAWTCQEEKCTSGSQGKNQPIARECVRTAKVLGPIVSYRRGQRSLDAAEIAACNAAQETARAAAGTDVAARGR